MNPDQQPKNPIAVMQDGEQVIAEIKRHPIGIITVYITAGLLLLALAVVAFYLVPSFVNSVDRSHVMSIAGLAWAVFAFLTIGFLFIANIVYWGNRWVITTDSITQITQNSLFNTQSSQLSLHNLEDISAEKNGILTHIFNYGVLKVETAGEHSKFQFIYCPNPNYYAQKVIDVREKFEQNKHEGAAVAAVQAVQTAQVSQPPQQPQA